MKGIDSLGKLVECDILVIGGGLAGALAAIRAREMGVKKVLLVDKARFGSSGCSSFAAGVITPFLPEEDDLESWLKEMVLQHNYLIDQEMARVYLGEAHLAIKDLESWGVEFLKKKDGRYERVFARGGDPERPIIKTMMFRGGGPILMEKVRKKVLDCGVKVIDRVMINDLLKIDDTVVGACGFDVRKGEFYIFSSRATIIATGGASFKSGYHGIRNITGDGHAMAYRAGVTLGNYEFLSPQIIMTDFDIMGFMMFVALGGRFLNKKDEAFLKDYDPILKDRTLLSPLAGAMALEHRLGNSPIYLDITHLTLDRVRKLREVIPLFVKIGERGGFIKDDKILKRLEVTPCIIGSIGDGGGIWVSERYEANLKGLLAVGPGAVATVAGAALTHCLVSGPKGGEAAAEYVKEKNRPARLDSREIKRIKANIYEPIERKDGIEPDVAISELLETIMPYDIFVIKKEDRIREALKKVEEIRERTIPSLLAYDAHYLMIAHEVKNMVECARLWLLASLERRESRDCHLREDYPFSDSSDGLRWILCKKKDEDDKVLFESVPIPIEGYPYRPETKEKTIYKVFKAYEERKSL